MELILLDDKIYKGLLLPASGNPVIITETLEKSLHYAFGDHDVMVDTFDGVNNYYHIINSQNLPINLIATHLKRIYTSDYTINNSIRGDILIYSSSKYLTDSIDNSVNYYFVQEVLNYLATISYVY